MLGPGTPPSLPGFLQLWTEVVRVCPDPGLHHGLLPNNTLHWLEASLWNPQTGTAFQGTERQSLTLSGRRKYREEPGYSVTLSLPRLRQEGSRQTVGTGKWGCCMHGSCLVSDAVIFREFIMV